jgi:uncharacterized protein (TIRG00374 family)
MKKKISQLLQYVIFLGGGIFLVWWQLKSMNLEEKNEFYNAIKNANFWILIPISIMSIMSHISRSMRWKLLMEPLDFHPKLRNVFMVTMVGYLANAAIPRLGELLKCTFLARYEKLKLDKLVGTIILERSFDLVCYAIFIAFTILIQIKIIGSFATEKLDRLFQGNPTLTFLKLGLVIGAIILFGFVIRWIIKKNPQNKLINKINLMIKGVFEGLSTIKHMKKKGAFLMHTIFIWCMYLGQIYLGFWGLDSTASLGIGAACSVLSLATLSMIVTPGGIGSFPIFVMQTLMIYGLTSAQGKAFGWLMWSASTGLIVLVGFVSLMLLPVLNKMNKSKK